MARGPYQDYSAESTTSRITDNVPHYEALSAIIAIVSCNSSSAPLPAARCKLSPEVNVVKDVPHYTAPLRKLFQNLVPFYAVFPLTSH